MINIACINRSTIPLGYDFGRLTAALQKCYDQCFLPIWSYPVNLYNTDDPRISDWQFIYMDNADEANALAYHSLTINGQPFSRVFTKTTLGAGESVSVSACHELFEMVIDPLDNLWAEAPNGVLYAYEMCDPVEEDTFWIDGVEMSNFVTPAWFEPFQHPRGTKFDFLGKLKRPFSMTKGGYVVVRERGKVREVFGSRAKARKFAKEDRRLHRSEYRK